MTKELQSLGLDVGLLEEGDPGACRRISGARPLLNRTLLPQE